MADEKWCGLCDRPVGECECALQAGPVTLPFIPHERKLQWVLLTLVCMAGSGIGYKKIRRVLKELGRWEGRRATLEALNALVEDGKIILRAEGDTA
jgi:hypothetical protein